ncbi:fibrosin-1-like protein isoform X2 [Protopterus annectens]|uniref:fibrosin-1-like protein isoform X2 n=1 Tax=Protopterus annectens TaxID=7888 RepID=UPI001CFAF9A2|nr:fibrosin-1-like protein isoform X2 [Protopterus annectens]
MDGKMKQSRRSRSQRDRARRRRQTDARDARDPSPSSGSDGEQSPGKENTGPNNKKAAPPARNPRPPRRRRRESSSQEEEIIDGFAIASFVTLEALEKDMALKPHERKEKWDQLLAKKRKETVKHIPTEPRVNGHYIDMGNSEREQERGKEQVRKKLPLRPFIQMRVYSRRIGKNSEEDSVQEATSSQRSSSRDRLTDSSAQSFSGRGYSCDSDSDIDDKASDASFEKLFAPSVCKGLILNDKSEIKVPSVLKVSGLERSQEHCTEILFFQPVPSPQPAPPTIGPPVIPVSTTNSRPSTPVKKEPIPPPEIPPRLTPEPQLLQEHRPVPPVAHVPPPSSHPVFHQIPYSSHSISRSSSTSSTASISLPKHLPPSPQLHLHPPSGQPVPLSISNLTTSHYALRPSPVQHHPAMFATPAALPPSSALPTNSLVIPGHPAGPGYSDHELLRQELNSRFLVQTSDRTATSLSSVPLLRAELHQHTHQHQHQHQHTHQHTFTPFPPSLPPTPFISPTAPPMVRAPIRNFEKYAPKLDSTFFRHPSFYPSYPTTVPSMPTMLPHSGHFGSLQGAFQPKTPNPVDIAGRPGAVPHTLLQKDPRVTDTYRPPVRKPGKWCAVHVQIAWQIYHHQQKMKQMHVEPHKLDINGKLDLFSRAPGPGAFPGFPYSHDLARPLLSTTGATHQTATPYGPSPHHSSFLPASHLADPFSRPGSFGGLGNLSSSAFGGLGAHTLGSSSLFAHKDSTSLQSFSSPHEQWNRLHRTPPSFPTPPQWPKPGDTERSSSISSHDRDGEKRDSSTSKDERERERDIMDKNRHSNRSSPASAPVTHQISNLIRSSSQNSIEPVRQIAASDRERSKELEREHSERLKASTPVELKVKQSRSPVKDLLSHERKASEDNIKPVIRCTSPYSKPVLTGSMKLSNIESKETERKPELLRDHQKIKNDVKVKEECKEDSDVVLVASESSQHSRSADHSTAATLHGHSVPSSVTGMPFSPATVGHLNLEHARMVGPLMNISPLVGRERLPHPGFAWDPVRDTLRDPYRSLDLHRRMDFQLRADPMGRFPTTAGFYDPERAYRDREPHDYSHEAILDARREHERMPQLLERERLHLREEFDRARMQHLHSATIDSHLTHVPPFMSPLSGMHYARLNSPNAVHNGILNRTPPTAALSAPPPLVPASSTRPVSPRRTTPLTNSESRDYSPSRNPKEVEAR